MKNRLSIICLLACALACAGPLSAKSSKPKTIPLVCDFPLGEKVYVDDIVFRDSIAYIAAGENGVLVINLADPAQPVQVHKLHTHDYTRRVAISGDILCIADQNLGFAYLTMPAYPMMISEFDTPSEVMFMDLCGPLLRIKCFDGDSMVYVNISDITQPRLWTENDTQTLQPSGNFSNPIYACDWTGLVVLRRDYPYGRQELGRVPFSSGCGGVSRFGSVCICESNSGLYVVDVSNPAFPAMLYKYTDLDEFLPFRPFALGRYGLVVTSTAGIQVIDVNDPLNIKVVATTGPEAIHSDADYSAGPFIVGVNQGMVYVALDYRLLIFDVSKYTE